MRYESKARGSRLEAQGSKYKARRLEARRLEGSEIRNTNTHPYQGELLKVTPPLVVPLNSEGIFTVKYWSKEKGKIIISRMSGSSALKRSFGNFLKKRIPYFETLGPTILLQIYPFLGEIMDERGVIFFINV